MLVFIRFRNDRRANETNDSVDKIDNYDLANPKSGKIHFKQFAFQCLSKYYFVQITLITLDRYYEKAPAWQKGTSHSRIQINEWMMNIIALII